ncbi:hypothetical protein [Streptomyces sp. NPDC051546]|uniref:hypothetical protein n=1 Tax=Streptomyces sp. NPDC051546 TaxID=3365655 RepID=UPI0037A706B9
MPLHYEVIDPLTIPVTEFNENHIAVLHVVGNRYSGQWKIDVLSQQERSGEAAALGTIEAFHDHQRDDLTDSPRYPQLGLDTAIIWLLTETKEKGWRLLLWEDASDKVPEDARKFTIGARVALGGDQFVPTPGVVYADEVLSTTKV